LNDFIARQLKNHYKPYSDKLTNELEWKDRDAKALDAAFSSIREWRQQLAYDIANLEFITGILGRFKVIDPKAIGAYVIKSAALVSRVEAMQPVVAERLLGIRTAPSKEYYEGGDLEQFRAEAVELWKSNYPKEPLIKLVFSVTKFERKIVKTYDEAAKTWSVSDRSYLQFKIIARIPDKIPGASGACAMVYIGVVNRDNLANTTSIGIHDRGRAFPCYEVLVSKVD
jgi:hypothetical protein